MKDFRDVDRDILYNRRAPEWSIAHLRRSEGLKIPWGRWTKNILACIGLSFCALVGIYGCVAATWAEISALSDPDVSGPGIMCIVLLYLLTGFTMFTVRMTLNELEWMEPDKVQ